MQDDINYQKKMAAEAAVEYIKNGQTIGLGTGSTVKYAIEAIGKKIGNDFRIECVPTSVESEILAKQYNIPLTSLDNVRELDLTIDGADEVDTAFCMIKGGGAALHREKVVASASKQVIIIVDQSKTVANLGAFPLPLEVTPFAAGQVLWYLQKWGFDSSLRNDRNGNLLVTDNGNHIIDCKAGSITDPESFDCKLRSIPGIVETGLFIGLLDILIIGAKDGPIIKKSDGKNKEKRMVNIQPADIVSSM